MTLPTRTSGESGALHLTDHNALHARHNEIGGLTLPADGYPATVAGPLAEFYNMMMAHFDGTRATPFFVNVQHPDFGATGRNLNTLNEQPAIQAAIDFLGDIYMNARTLWLPAVSTVYERSRYFIDDPIRLHTGLRWSAYGARIAASPRFDFVTAFPTQEIEDYPQAMLENYNVTAETPLGRFSQARLSLNGGLIEGMDMPSSRGAIVNLQQQSSWQGLRFDECEIGIIIGGQQGIFHDLMVTAPSSNSPSSIHPYVGIQLGIESVPNYPASFFYFYGTNVEGCYRAVRQLAGVGANVFRDSHFEGISTTDVANPAFVFHLSQGQLVVDQSWWTAEGGNPIQEHGTFLHRDDTTSSYHLKDIFVQTGGPPNDHSILVNDVDAGHTILGWGETKLSVGEEGVVRHIQELIRPKGAEGQARRHVISILHDEGGYTALGSYDAGTADAEQLPNVSFRPGATQMGHLVSWYDKAGVERFLVTADGVPKLPGFTTAARPNAVGRQAVMIYNLDANKPQISDGASWVDLY